MRHLTFREWLEIDKDRAEAHECSHCDGSGECICECGNIHDCEECDGHGNFLYNVYEKQLEKDAKLLEEFKKRG